jgi:hypothetical protein
MTSPQRSGPSDLTASSKPQTPSLHRSRTLTFALARIGNNPLPQATSAPVPRRATNDTTLSSDIDDDRRYSTPQSSPPSAQPSLNGVTNAQHGPFPGGSNVRAPHHDHSRTSSRASAKSSPRPSSKKSPHSSPSIIVTSPNQIPSPPLRDATPIRSPMRQTPPLPGILLKAGTLLIARPRV